MQLSDGYAARNLAHTTTCTAAKQRKAGMNVTITFAALLGQSSLLDVACLALAGPLEPEAQREGRSGHGAGAPAGPVPQLLRMPRPCISVMPAALQ